jgi:hypothetical protein
MRSTKEDGKVGRISKQSPSNIVFLISVARPFSGKIFLGGFGF